MLLVAGSPLMVVITSSGRNPAVAAGPPGDTAWTNSPSGTPAWGGAAGGRGGGCTPEQAGGTRPAVVGRHASDGLGPTTRAGKPQPQPAAARLAGRARHRRAGRRHAHQLAL